MGSDLLLLLACVSTGDDSPTAPATPASPDMVVQDANNYHYSGSFDAPSIATAELTDLDIAFTDVHQDFQCHDVDPVADIDNVAFMLFPHLTEAEVEDGFSSGTLGQTDLQLYLSYQPGDDTTLKLTDLTFFGTDADVETFYEGANGTFLLLIASGTSVGVGTRDLLFLAPTPGETNTSVAFSDGCGILDFTGDLHDLTPLPVASEGPWTLDWSGLTVDGQGAAINANNIDQLMVARYDESTTELEGDFFDLETLADDLWLMDLSGGTSTALDGLANDAGPFPGFSADGTWLLALRCSLCANPAPIFMTELAPGG